MTVGSICRAAAGRSLARSLCGPLNCWLAVAVAAVPIPSLELCPKC